MAGLARPSDSAGEVIPHPAIPLSFRHGIPRTDYARGVLYATVAGVALGTLAAMARALMAQRPASAPSVPDRLLVEVSS